MLKLLAKVAEKYARSTNTCMHWILGLLHQPNNACIINQKRLIII